MAVQQTLEDEQRAILIDRLIVGEYPLVLIQAAAYTFATGAVKRYGKFDIEVWVEAMKLSVPKIGQINKAFREGYNAAVDIVMSGISKGQYDEFLASRGYVKAVNAAVDIVLAGILKGEYDELLASHGYVKQ